MGSSIVYKGNACNDLIPVWLWLGCLFIYQSLEEFMNQGNSSVGFFKVL
ncbi:hypothetical protein WN944_019669 [Citrus x changshan-huyou]|uniref:Uncharacterized protein n=1 Tax=Citrus x changshan-huyou TaxID=2935761 RepID=A0AAP0QG33_9ROSI